MPQLIAVHLDGCSWLCRLHLWGGRPAQPCRALAVAHVLQHVWQQRNQRAAHTVGPCSQHLPAHRTTPQRECGHLHRMCWTKQWGTGPMYWLSRRAVLATAPALQHISPDTHARPWGTFGWETRKENHISRVDQIQGHIYTKHNPKVNEADL